MMYLFYSVSIANVLFSFFIKTKNVQKITFLPYYADLLLSCGVADSLAFLLGWTVFPCRKVYFSLLTNSSGLFFRVRAPNMWVYHFTIYQNFPEISVFPLKQSSEI